MLSLLKKSKEKILKASYKKQIQKNLMIFLNMTQIFLFEGKKEVPNKAKKRGIEFNWSSLKKWHGDLHTQYNPSSALWAASSIYCFTHTHTQPKKHIKWIYEHFLKLGCTCFTCGHWAVSMDGWDGWKNKKGEKKSQCVRQEGNGIFWFEKRERKRGCEVLSGKWD